MAVHRLVCVSPSLAAYVRHSTQDAFFFQGIIIITAWHAAVSYSGSCLFES